MTCEDCIHFKKIEYPKGVHLPEGDMALTHGICTTAKPKIWVKPSNNACRTFQSKEDSWESISK